MFTDQMRNRISESTIKLQDYVCYLDKLKYKNEVQKQANIDLFQLCRLLHDILAFDTYGDKEGSIIG
jgi:hypothetical protein